MLSATAALGGTALVPWLETSAESRAAPLRFLAIFTPNGTLPDQWVTAGSSEQAFVLGPLLAPLEPWRDRLLLFRHLDLAVAEDSLGNEHQKGIGAFLTGQQLLEGSFCGGDDCESGPSGWAAGASLDQLLATELGHHTRFRSLELGVGIEGKNNRHRMSYRAAGEPLPVIDDPKQLYARLFEHVDAGLQRQRSTVLDSVARELESLRSAVSGADRARLDAHLQSIRELERQLNIGDGGCADHGLDAELDPRRHEHYPRLGRQQCDLLALALGCDITRIATLMWSGATAKQPLPWVELAGTPILEGHHALTHEPYSDPRLEAQRRVRDKLVNIKLWYSEQVAYLLAKLDAIEQSDGSTLLDNTIVLWGTDVARPDTHELTNMPFALIGGGGGLRGGRLVDCGHRQHNDLLVAIAQRMGLAIETFGHPEYSSGPLPDL